MYSEGVTGELILSPEPTKLTASAADASPTDSTALLKKLLPADTLNRLLANADSSGNAKLSQMLYSQKHMTATLLPQSSIAQSVFSAWQNPKTVFMIETLYLYKKPQHSAADLSAANDILHSVSTLEGIQYYSSSRKKMRTLYEKSYAVHPIVTAKGKGFEKTPDNLTAKEQLVLQKDLTFGEYIYKYSYKKTDGGVGFVCENTQTLTYGIFSLVDPYNMNVALAVHDAGDYLLIYANTRANFVKLPGITNKLQNSFSTRADALYNWFIGEYKKR